MSTQTWEIISIVGFAAAALMGVIASVMFFTMKIPGVIGIVTGKTASKNIKKVWDEARKQDAESGKLKFFRKKENEAGVPIGDRTMDLYTAGTGGASGPKDDSTELLMLSRDAAPAGNDNTELLTFSRGAAAPDDDTELLAPTRSDASPPAAPDLETDLLSAPENPEAGRPAFRVVRSETGIHTDALIP